MRQACCQGSVMPGSGCLPSAHGPPGWDGGEGHSVPWGGREEAPSGWPTEQAGRAQWSHPGQRGVSRSPLLDRPVPSGRRGRVACHQGMAWHSPASQETLPEPARGPLYRGTRGRGAAAKVQPGVVSGGMPAAQSCPNLRQDGQASTPPVSAHLWHRPWGSGRPSAEGSCREQVQKAAGPERAAVKARPPRILPAVGQGRALLVPSPVHGRGHPLGCGCQAPGPDGLGWPPFQLQTSNLRAPLGPFSGAADTGQGEGPGPLPPHTPSRTLPDAAPPGRSPRSQDQCFSLHKDVGACRG